MVDVRVGVKGVKAKMYLIVDADSLEELNRLADELHERGYKVWAKIEERGGCEGGWV